MAVYSWDDIRARWQDDFPDENYWEWLKAVYPGGADIPSLFGGNLFLNYSGFVSSFLRDNLAQFQQDEDWQVANWLITTQNWKSYTPQEAYKLWQQQPPEFKTAVTPMYQSAQGIGVQMQGQLPGQQISRQQIQEGGFFKYGETVLEDETGRRKSVDIYVPEIAYGDVTLKTLYNLIDSAVVIDTQTWEQIPSDRFTLIDQLGISEDDLSYAVTRHSVDKALREQGWSNLVTPEFRDLAEQFTQQALSGTPISPDKMVTSLNYTLSQLQETEQAKIKASQEKYAAELAELQKPSPAVSGLSAGPNPEWDALVKAGIARQARQRDIQRESQKQRIFKL